MPVKSYLIFPRPGKFAELLEVLLQYKNCDVYPSGNKSVFAVVTETQTEEEDKDLLIRLQSEEHLHHINLISGFSSEAYEKKSVQD